MRYVLSRIWTREETFNDGDDEIRDGQRVPRSSYKRQLFPYGYDVAKLMVLGS